MTRRRRVLGLLLVWIVLAVGGVWLHGHLHPDGSRGAEQVRAASDLPANHRIGDADLAVDASRRVRRSLPAVRNLIGRYLVASKPKGEAITIGDVTELPSLSTGAAGSATVVYELPEPHRALAELLDVGAQVLLCAPAAKTATPLCHHDPVKVLAVHPAGPGAADAWLLLGLPTADETAMQGYLTAEGRYVVVVAAASR